METKRSCVGLMVLVVIIVVVAILVIVLRPTWKIEMPVERTFHVSMMREEGNPSRSCYVIDGQTRPTLRLKRDRRYRFVLSKGCHPMYLTTSDAGGPSLVGSIASNVDKKGMVAEDSDLYIVTSKGMVPSVMYYQSTLEEGVGGRVLIG